MKKDRTAQTRENAVAAAMKARNGAEWINERLTEAFQALYRWMDRIAIRSLSARTRQDHRVSDDEAVERYCRSLRERRRAGKGPKLEF